MSPTDSFEVLLAQLRAGENEAAARVFHHFADQLIVLARAQLQGTLQSKLDPEDVLQSVFRSFFRRFQAGQLDLENWECLWGVLTVMTLHKCGHLQEYFLAARRDVRREEMGTAQAIEALGNLCAREPTPEEAVCLTDLLEHLLHDFDECERRIITLHLQGYNQIEIGQEVSRAERTVRRTIARARKRLERLQDESVESV